MWECKGERFFFYTRSGLDRESESGRAALLLSAQKVRNKSAIAMVCLKEWGFCEVGGKAKFSKSGWYGAYFK